VDELATALRRFESTVFDAAVLRRSGERFAPHHFEAGVLASLEGLVGEPSTPREAAALGRPG
jgi:hypothetical protein